MDWSAVWERVRDDVLGTQAPPTEAGGWLAFGLALVAVVLPSAWRWTRRAVTIAHEGAHALAAVLSGRRLAGIRVHADASGLTLSRGRPTGPGMVATAAAGYVGPALLGLGAAYLLHERRALLVLWLTVLLLALVLAWTRNGHGLLAVALTLALVLGVTWWGQPRAQSLLAHAGTWFLLLGAPRTVWELQVERRRTRGRTSDADVLARLTRVPGLAWVGLFGLVCLLCLGAGARWLLPGDLLVGPLG